MNPQEKANELIDKFKDILNIRNDMRPTVNPFAKQCALYSVDQVLETLQESFSETKVSLGVLQGFLSYWIAVRSQLEKMQ